jgi:hypothetical protein
MEVERWTCAGIHVERNRCVFVHDLPDAPAPLEQERLAHPEVDRVIGAILRSVHVEEAMSEREIANY